MSRTTTVLTIAAGVTVVSGFIAYAAYFDYKRRNDAEFRKKLRTYSLFAWLVVCIAHQFVRVGKDKKKVKKVAETEKSPALNVNIEDLRAAVEKIHGEQMPESSTAREEYFMQQVGMGEQLCAQGGSLSFVACMSSIDRQSRPRTVDPCCTGFLPRSACVSLTPGADGDLREDCPTRSLQGMYT